jgi:two-component system sensor histidine kinase/response regulator
MGNRVCSLASIATPATSLSTVSRSSSNPMSRDKPRPSAELAAPQPNLLVIDDQESNLKVVGTMLERLGFKSTLCTNAEQAIIRLEKGSVDLILLDVLMPGRDGFETCTMIRSNPLWADIPIIFLSAADDKSLIVRALEVGGVDYVTKPFNDSELLSRVKTHVALKLARDRLKQLAEDKDELLGILAHDLQNHLGGMKMTVQLLRRRAEKQANLGLEDVAANIQMATDQMFAFVVEFLANSAAERGHTIKIEPVWLHEVAAETVANYAETAARKKITLTTDGAASAPIAADRKALDQVLDNLVSNALKFSPMNSTVRISIEDDPKAGGAVCRVSDEGPGFTEDDKARMFHRYRRLSARPTAGEPSTGLGLSIVRKLVKDIGGLIACESTAGQGATFVLRFPTFRRALAQK